MRLRFALAAALPALVSLAAMAYLADQLVRRALEDELAARLVAAAQATAAALPADRVSRLAAGDEGTRTYRNVRSRLGALAQATGTRLFVIRPDRTALADSAGKARIGEGVPALERDRLEVALAAEGKAVPSQLLFEGSDGLLYKTGYAPLRGAGGKVVAVVGADGTAASFATYRRFRRLLALFAVAGAALGALVAAGAALSVTRPLTRLTAAARRIGRGDLETPLWVRNRKDEIGTLRDTLEEMRKALRARDEERETLLAGIAHEVRNPLGALDLFAGLLAEELAARPTSAAPGRAADPPDAGAGTLAPCPTPRTGSVACVARIQAEVAALTKVVEEFLDYARARPPVREAVDLGVLLAEVAELAGPLAAERQVSLMVEGAGVARADREQLRRAVLNLVRNAVEAAPAASEVEVVAGAARSELAVEVRDRGPGLTPEARASLFRPFFTTKEKGTGLGLALAKKVADAHGGTLALASREGGGTVARLSLPGEGGA
jgi:signal transduction histidine kinase